MLQSLSAVPDNPQQSNHHYTDSRTTETPSANQRPALTPNDQWEARNDSFQDTTVSLYQGMHKTNQRTIAELLAKQKLYDINKSTILYFFAFS